MCIQLFICLYGVQTLIGFSKGWMVFLHGSSLIDLMYFVLCRLYRGFRLNHGKKNHFWPLLKLLCSWGAHKNGMCLNLNNQIKLLWSNPVFLNLLGSKSRLKKFSEVTVPVKKFDSVNVSSIWIFSTINQTIKLKTSSYSSNSVSNKLTNLSN